MREQDKEIAFKPYVSADKTYPELTVKAIILGTILAAVLGASNAYLGLKIGQTITACIPAAVASMAILRLFRESNILENNMVQTMASAGEVMAAASIFTLPALIIIGYWRNFSYFETASITIVGGFIGIFFSIPLRRALIVEKKLTYPEGVATAQVLEAGDRHGSNISILVKAGLFSAIIQFCQTGLQILSDSVTRWFFVKNTVCGFGSGLSVAMIGAGYIVGIRVGLGLLCGAILMYGIAIPFYGLFAGLPEAANAGDAAMMIKSQLRYIGVGAMLVGGVAALFSVLKPIKIGIMHAFSAFKNTGREEKTIRTDKDIPMKYVLIGTLLLFIPVAIFVHHVLMEQNLPISSGKYALTIVATVFGTFIIGFLTAAISGYLSGLVGNSATPLSGILIASVLLIAFMFMGIMGNDINFQENTQAALGVAAAIILITAVVASIGAVSCDNLQDLKSGYILGSTPWKQQTGLFIGVIVSAFVITPVLKVLFEAYGMGGVFPREGMDPAKNLAAPQAVLIATVAKGIIAKQLPYNMIAAGGLISVAVIIFNKIMANMGRVGTPVLAVSLGLYLPLDMSIPLFIGGLLSFLAMRHRAKMPEKKSQAAYSSGILFASGAIAGEALIGIFLAIPFAALQSTTIFRYVPDFIVPYIDYISLIIVGFLCWLLYRAATGRSKA